MPTPGTRASASSGVRTTSTLPLPIVVEPVGRNPAGQCSDKRVHAGDLHQALGLPEVHAHVAGGERPLGDIGEQLGRILLRAHVSEADGGVQQDLQSLTTTLRLRLRATESESEGGSGGDVVDGDPLRPVRLIQRSDDDGAHDPRGAVQGGIRRARVAGVGERHPQGEERFDRTADHVLAIRPHPLEKYVVGVEDGALRIHGDQPARGQSQHRSPPSSSGDR